MPVALVPPGQHQSGYRVLHRTLSHAEVFGRSYWLTRPLDCCLLFDPEGRLWMSTTPQEHMMMYNNGLHSWGCTLVGGLGLGLYPQYAATGAAGKSVHFTIIERSPVVKAIVEPTLLSVLNVPLEVRVDDIETYLRGSVTTRYDTIFLDTWDALDAVHLPKVNRMRDLALRHLAPNGRVLLWGYRWMVRLYEDACRQLLEVAPAHRMSWLMAEAKVSPQAEALLIPVVERFHGQVVEDMEAPLSWCRDYIVRLAP